MSTPPDSTARLVTLEEHAAYTEHTIDQLSGEIAELNKRVHALVTRLDSLESRLTKLLSTPEGGPGESEVESGGSE